MYGKSVIAAAAIAFVTSMGAVSAAEMSILEGITAEPMTEAQMARVTGAFTVNGNDIATIVFNEPVEITILAGEGENAGLLPTEVHDNNAGEDVFFVGAGMWSAGLALAGQGNTNPPIVHF